MTLQTSSKEHSKSNKVAKKTVPHTMQDRDREILKHIHENRFLTTELISLLVDGSDQVIRRRLHKLRHNGFVIRVNERQEGSKIYALTDKAYKNPEAKLNLYFDIKKPSARMTEKNRAVKYDPFVNHHLLIAKIRITLTLALKDKQDYELIEWVPDKERTNEYFIMDNGREVPRTFAPDSFITIGTPRGKLYFFLEADRHTEDGDRFLAKMRKYWSYRPAWLKEVGVNVGFRVLTIALTKTRADNLKKVTKQADDKKTGSEMYWFTSETNFNPENPETILREIWQTPRDDIFHSLFEVKEV